MRLRDITCPVLVLSSGATVLAPTLSDLVYENDIDHVDHMALVKGEIRPDLDVLVRPVRSRPLRRFILQQTLLASLVEGRRSPAELAFLKALNNDAVV